MNKNVGEPIMRDDYELRGKDVDPRLIEISVGMAGALRDHLSQVFFPEVMDTFPERTVVRELTETEDAMQFGSSFGPNVYSLRDVGTSGFTGVRLKHFAAGWKMRAFVSTMEHDGTPNKTAVRYIIDVDEGFIQRAIVQTRLLRTNSDECFDQLLDEQPDTATEPESTRVMYERQLNQKDCIRLQTLLQRGLHRAHATDKRAKLMPKSALQTRRR